MYERVRIPSTPPIGVARTAAAPANASTAATWPSAEAAELPPQPLDTAAMPDTTLGWTLVQDNPTHDGLSQQGQMHFEIEFSTRAAVAVIAHVLPCAPDTGQPGTELPTSAEPMTHEWLEVTMRQIPNSWEPAFGLSIVEIVRCNAESRLEQVSHSVRSVMFPTELYGLYNLQISYRDGTIQLTVQHHESGQCLVQASASDFGSCMPMVRLRSGRQPFSSSVLRANFNRVR